MASPDQRLSSLADKERRVKRWWRQATPEQEELVLKVVIESPTLSKYKIAEKLEKIVGYSILGAHGVYNVLKRRNLTLPEARLTYSQAMIPIAKPVPWVDRLHLVWEQFIPSLVPAPPPQLKELTKAFLTPFAFSSILGFLFLLWFQMLSGQSFSAQLGLFFATLSLTFGAFFFLYSLKYYFTLVLILGFSRQVNGGNGGESGIRNQESVGGNGEWSIWQRIFGFANHRNGHNGEGNGNGKNGGNYLEGGLRPDLSQIKLQRHPFVSIHLPLYNEKRVVERLLTACAALDYENYEVVVVDDSTDETTEIAKQFLKREQRESGEIKGDQMEKVVFTPATPRSRNTPGSPAVTLIHRSSRAGFKGGALQVALQNTNPRAEFVVVFDADFLPYPDTITQFLKYFQVTAGGLDFRKASSRQPLASRGEQLASSHQPLAISNSQLDANQLAASGSPIAAVQGYQWHVLNKSENWITRGVRSEYAGSYVVERSGGEILGSLKQIAGSVYMIRKDILDKYGWGQALPRTLN